MCYQDEAQDSSLWFSPNNIAPRFSHFRSRQENEFDFAMAFRCLLDDPERSASLSEFVSLLAGCDATDKGDATDEGAATDVGDVGLGMPTEDSGVTSSNQAASSRTEVMPPFNTEQHRAAPNDTFVCSSS